MVRIALVVLHLHVRSDRAAAGNGDGTWNTLRTDPHHGYTPPAPTVRVWGEGAQGKTRRCHAPTGAGTPHSGPEAVPPSLARILDEQAVADAITARRQLDYVGRCHIPDDEEGHVRLAMRGSFFIGQSSPESAIISDAKTERIGLWARPVRQKA
jgi:hypothetical protein